MRILLVLPFNVYNGEYNNEIVRKGGAEAEIPLGLAYLKSYLISKLPNIHVQIYDSNIDALNYIVNEDKDVKMDFFWKRLEHKITTFDPDVVGISAFSHTIAEEAHKVAKLCRKVNNKILTVLGGSYPTLSYDTAMEDNNVDFIVRSEGEIVFCDLVKSIMRKTPFSKINGLVYRKDGQVFCNQLKTKISNLDDLPYPQLDDLPVELYGKLPRHSLQRTIIDLKPISMVSSRGCMFNCGFCATKRVWGHVRNRSPKNIIKEIKNLKKKYDMNFVKFNDDLFTSDKDRVIELCNLLIKEKLVDHWSSTGVTVSSLLNKKMVDKMIESGFHYFTLPIESGSQKTLRAINKPVTLDMVRRVIATLREYDQVYITGVFVVGFPSETKEDIQATYDFATSLDLNWACFNIFTPFPETPLFDECINKGFLRKKKITYHDLQNTHVLSTPNFDKEWLATNKYINNLRINFLNNYYLKRKKYKEAMNEFAHVLKLAPDHAIALLLSGYAYEMLGDELLAHSYFDKAISILKNDRLWNSYFHELKDTQFGGFRLSNKYMDEGVLCSEMTRQ